MLTRPTTDRLRELGLAGMAGALDEQRCHSDAAEDVDHRAARGLDRALLQKLTGGEWIERHQDLLVTGPTGTGKTWQSCALGHRVCRGNRSVLYHRVPRLLEALGIARGDGRYARMLKSLARV